MEQFADDRAFLLGIRDPLQRVQELFGRVDRDQAFAHRRPKGLDHLFRLALAHHARVDKDAPQLIADRLAAYERMWDG